MRRSTSIGTLSVAAVVGVALGVAGFLVAPFDADQDDSASPAGRPETPASASARPSDPGDAPAPAFTRNALLLTEEFLRFGWGTAERTAVSDGEPRELAELALLCFGGDEAAENSRDAYAGSYRGQQTEAREVVARFADADAAEQALSGLSDRVAECAGTREGTAATPGTRHAPRLDGVDEALWWNTANRSGSGERPSSQGVIGLARVGDRLVTLSLTSTSSDPAETTDVEALLRQAARRLV